MRLSAIISLASLATSVAAYGDSGAWERLYFWYAYELDGLDASNPRKSIAPACASFPKRCTFSQFIQYINKEDALVLSALQVKEMGPNGKPTGKMVDMQTNDPEKAATAISKAQATGQYRVELLTSGGVKTDPAYTNLERFNAFFDKLQYSDKLDELPNERKQNLRIASRSILSCRVSAQVSAFSEWAGGKPNFITTPIPTIDVEIYEGSGPDQMAKQIAPGQAILKGKDKRTDYKLQDLFKQWKSAKAGASGHDPMQIAAEKAAKRHTDACRASRS